MKRYVVKKLEWAKEEGPLLMWRANSVLCSLEVWQHPKRALWYWGTEGGGGGTSFESLDEAKAAAENWYRERIESALEEVN